MKLVSINELSLLTGHTREKVAKDLANVSWTRGTKNANAKLFDSTVALRTLYRGSASVDLGSGEKPTDQLALKRVEQINLEMEISRKERIPLSDLNEINDEVFQSTAALLKAHKGKVLTEEVINDIFANLRGVPEKLKCLTQ